MHNWDVARPQQALITSVIPTRDDLANLPNAVDSVLASHPHAIAMVVDDGSVDGTARWLAACTRTQARIDGVSLRESLGAGAARNLGVALVTTPFVSFLDSDDMHVPGFYEHAIDLLSRFPRAAAVRGAVELTNLPSGVSIAPDDPRVRAVGDSVVWNVVLRTAVARALGFPLTAFFKRTMYDDHAFSFGLRQFFDVVLTGRVACRHSVRAGGHTHGFLARSRAVADHFEFTELRAEEQDGSMNRELIDFWTVARARMGELAGLVRSQGTLIPGDA
jgi:glycosyltransferase involved in cell wall biosynthesis